MAFVPIVPALEPIPLVMCWNTDQDSPAREAFMELVLEREEDIRKGFK